MHQNDIIVYMAVSSPVNARNRAFDPILRETHPVYEWLSEDTNNIIFVVNGKKWCMKRSYFMENAITPYYILLDCVKGKSGRYNSLDEKYIHLQIVGIPDSGMLPIQTLPQITNTTDRIFVFRKSKHRISTVPELEMTATIIHNKDFSKNTIDLHENAVAGVVEDQYIPIIRSYSQYLYRYVNHYLRSKQTDTEYAVHVRPSRHTNNASGLQGLQALKQKIALIDEIFAKYATISTVPIKVYRGTGLNTGTIDEYPYKVTPPKQSIFKSIGTKISSLATSFTKQKEPAQPTQPAVNEPYQGISTGYLSTTTDKHDVAYNFASKKEGCCVYEYTIQPGVPFISLHRNSTIKSEYEILLPRGITIVLNGTEEKDGLLHYIADVKLTTPDQFKYMEQQCKTYPVLLFGTPETNTSGVKSRRTRSVSLRKRTPRTRKTRPTIARNNTL
jgi:hypothetical protein